MLAAEGAQAALLKKEFPNLTILPLEGYRVRYSRSRRWFALRILLQVPRLLRVIRREHCWLQDAIRAYRIDLVVSDNRFGLYSSMVPCLFITHQLTIKAPFAWLEDLTQRINYRFINRFAACWVPDVAGEDSLAGVLSNPDKKPRVPVHYLGLLSRLRPSTADTRYKYCFVLSGPEPQRTLLEQRVLAGIGELNGQALLVRGLPAATELIAVPQQVTVVNHLSSTEMEKAMQESEFIISRSGYTTVMEIIALRKKAVLIPTPGQTEQEYLAARLHAQQRCYTVAQERFDCLEHLRAAERFSYLIRDTRLFEPSQLPKIPGI